ncbi:uncharacterized protein LOC113566648 [Drosophila persimilis]|uniref:uncharacterized protein LOC113566648 n=1 Tax=Drosophila persimilis TaxID=7234 RepID=UPI000F076508|nr:uncharacterized protein LOC113566648 [Drosophila persimilis]
MCQAEQFFQAKHFCRYLSLRSGGLIIALFSDLLAIVSLAGFFRLFFDRTSENMIRETFAVFWGVLHFVAANCLSVSLIMTSPTPVLVYIVIEGCFLAFTIVYVLQSAVMAIHLNANMCIGNCIVYWIFVGITWVLLPYFLYITISIYFAKKQRLRDAVDQVE